ncbi:MAG: xanthine dehydrogenase family protein molybdopterin-binding subunit [Alphaproteobacteria bacterium]|nr:xanthine dehydrogenase family protein molybdopterin-binding subunit [Alphaproteobacteria bacterium]
MGQFGMGQSVRRVEDHRLVTGHGRYTDDISLQRQAHAVVLRSPHAHARITRLDTAAASELPGVLAVYTGADLKRDGIGDIPFLTPLPNRDGSACKAPPYPVLVTDRVRHVGDAVALVVAETLAAARDAAEQIAIDYDMLPATAGTAAALEPGQPLVWDEAPNNLQLDWEIGDKAATDAAFARARHVVGMRLGNNRLVPNSMEPRGAIGEWDEGEQRYTLHSSTQGSHPLRQMLQGVLNVPENRIRVVTPDVGGGFGMKLFLYREYVLVLYAAKKLGRPVKWTGERVDAFLSDTHGRDNVTDAELALDENGRFLGIRVATIANMGAYLSNFSSFIPTLAGTQMLTGLYTIPAAYVGVKCVFTNTVPVDAYRGAGRPEAAFVVERIVDVAARRLGLSGAELRRRNFVKAEQMPYNTSLGLTYDSGDFVRNMDDALRHADHAGFAARRAAARAKGKLLGFGISTYIEQCGTGGDEMAELRFDPSGSVTLLIGTQSSGQGHQTAYSQFVADGLGIPLEQIRVTQGDSDAVGFGRGTGGSRSLPVGGPAVSAAVAKIIEKTKKIAAHRLEAAEADIEFADGNFRIAGTDRSVDFTTIAKSAFEPGSLPPGMEAGLDEKAHYMHKAATFPNGCHACEVEVDLETGTTRILRFVVVDDFGRVVNPLLLAGQVQGGVGQGVGQALLEDCIYDAESGQLVTGSLMDYCMPRADNFPDIEFSYNVVPCTTNPLGIKGAGEAGAIGAPPAIINAIVDALADYGVEHVEMPATPERVWRAITEAQPAQAAE